LKLVTVLGTRPEIIRLSRMIHKLDHLCDHKLVHTGQNFDPSLSNLFFEELGVRRPDYHLGATGDTFGQQVGQILSACDTVLCQEQPDALLLLGDTNSGLCSILAKRQGILVYHMEAGNRCYDDRVPEEVNRRIIDHSSDILMPYTERSRQNLLREGIPGQRIYVTGNPIYEVIHHYDAHIRDSTILDNLAHKPQEYFLVTMHRAENVDVKERLIALITSLNQLQNKYNLPVIISTHPRARARLKEFGAPVDSTTLQFSPPFGFFDFITLERNAFCVLSDSGTVQEECSILGIPNVTIRDVTERPETIECGSSMLSGVQPEQVSLCVEAVLSMRGKWVPPPEYLVPNVSDIVIKIVLGYRHSSRL